MARLEADVLLLATLSCVPGLLVAHFCSHPLLVKTHFMKADMREGEIGDGPLRMFLGRSQVSK